MEWIALKRALVYGQPAISREMLQPQTVKTAVREIARLVSIGWIDTPTEDMVQRIQRACLMGHCEDVWDALQTEQHPLLKIAQRPARTPKIKPRKRG